MKDIKYISGGIELLDSIRTLWEQLIVHHAEISKYFSEDLLERTFPKRKDGLIEKSKQGKLRVDLARSEHHGKYVGYCVSVVNKKNIGEIESIFVEEDFRNSGIGDTLMNKTLKWMKTQQVESKIVKVATGNDHAHLFYSKYGFLPRITVFQQKK